MRSKIIVIGTDTGVGKSTVCRALHRDFVSLGLKSVILKPLETGGSEDTLGHLNAMGNRLSRGEICYQTWKTPASPLHSAQVENSELSWRALLDFCEKTRDFDCVLIETAGGSQVPLCRMRGNILTNIDFAQELHYPCVVVGRAGLGTINHTVMTLESLRMRGVDVLGFVLSGEAGGLLDSNIEAIREMTDAKFLGHLGPGDSRLDSSQILKSLKEYEKNKAAKSQLGAASLKSLWFPFTQMTDYLEDPPIVITRAKGVWLESADGRKFIDGHSSLWVNIHGHSHPKIARAIARQAHTLDHSTLLGLANDPSAVLSQKLLEIAPAGFSKVFYSDNGSTAVEVALKMALHYRIHRGQKQKNKFLTLENAYHGDTVGAMSVGGIGLFQGAYQPLLFEALRSPVNFESIEKTIVENHDRLAAVVMEPSVQAAGGILTIPDGFLSHVSSLAKKYDIHLILDEVATGFGRTGKMFACEWENIAPDFMAISKGITGGTMPLSATLVTQEIFEAFLGEFGEFKTFFHGHSYTGNPLACAAALASLEIFESENVLENLEEKISFLKAWAKGLEACPHVGEIRHRGMIMGIDIVQEKSPAKKFDIKKRTARLICKRALNYGAILRPLGDTVVVMPPLSISLEELQILTGAITNAIVDHS